MSSKKKTAATKEDDKPALVPKLRFPEFRDPDTWQSVTLGSVLSEHGLKSDGASEVHSVSLTHGVVSQLEHMGRSYAAADTSHYSFVRPFDVVYTRSPLAIYRLGIVKQHRGPKTAIISPLYGVFAPANRHIGYIVEAYFDSPSRSISYLDPLAQKGAKNTIQLSNERFLSGQIVLPTDEPEQKKIAECLSSVDELMAAQSRKVDALKTHKKGLMQQLFPREGETQPRLRFPEFQNAGDWVQKMVGDVSEVLMCKRIFAEETNTHAGVSFYKIGTLGGIPDAFISSEKFEDYKSRYNYPRKGEVLITCAGTVGKCRPFDGKDAYFQDSNIVWLDNPTGEVSNEFLLMLLSNVNWGRLNSTTITRIYGPDLRGMAIKYPEDEAEQKRIASCLSSLDALITAETQKHEALKTHKKGLMQQLFPSPEEVEA